MGADDSITRWIGLLKEGDRGAAQPLWEAYFRRLVGLARARLGGPGHVVADEEDVALSAFDSFCRGAEAGRFPRLEDRDDLWKLLLVITAMKARDLIEHEGRAKRGGGRARAFTDLGERDIAEIMGSEPSPALAAEIAEQTERLLGLLGGGTLREVALLKLQGFTNAEIAGRLGCVRYTVDRKLQAIRGLWSGEVAG